MFQETYKQQLAERTARHPSRVPVVADYVIDTDYHRLARDEQAPDWLRYVAQRLVEKEAVACATASSGEL